MTTKKPKFPPRVRFNWGYHDGASDQAAWIVANWAHGRFDRDGRAAMRKHDRFWAEGFEAGEQARREGTYSGDSSLAWKAHVST